MLPSSGLLYKHGEHAWYHISSLAPTTKLRRIDTEAPEQIFRSPDDQERLQRIVDTSDIYSVGEIAVAVSPHLVFQSRGFPYEERAKWLELAELPLDLEPASLASEVPPNPLPITRLRRFYETLRLFPTKAVHGPILGLHPRDGDSADFLDVRSRCSRWPDSEGRTRMSS